MEIFAIIPEKRSERGKPGKTFGDHDICNKPLRIRCNKVEGHPKLKNEQGSGREENPQEETVWLSRCSWGLLTVPVHLQD